VKRADVKAGVLYAVKHGDPVMVVKEELWALVKQRGHEDVWRLAEKGEKPYRDRFGGYRSIEIGLPAAERVPLMMPNPEYVGEEEAERIRAELRSWSNGDYARYLRARDKNPLLQEEIPDPLRWEWKPTILEPRDALAPLDEHEAARRAEQERQNAEREATQRKIDALNKRVTALLDVLPLNETQRRDLGSLRYPIGAPRPAEVTLEWLEEVAGRLRQGSGCVEVH
jgi:hypothetical protein